MGQIGSIAIVYVVEMTACFLYLDMVLLLQFLDEEVLRILLTQELRQEVCRQSTVKLILTFGRQTITNMRRLITCLLLL